MAPTVALGSLSKTALHMTSGEAAATRLTPSTELALNLIVVANYNLASI